MDDKHILLTITNEACQQLISNQEVKAGEAESKINLVFGSIDNFKNIIQRLLSDNILFLKITEKEIFKVSTSHTYCNPDNGAYELSFIYTHTSIADANNISLVTKKNFYCIEFKCYKFFRSKKIYSFPTTSPPSPRKPLPSTRLLALRMTIQHIVNRLKDNDYVKNRRIDLRTICWR